MVSHSLVNNRYNKLNYDFMPALLSLVMMSSCGKALGDARIDSVKLDIQKIPAWGFSSFDGASPIRYRSSMIRILDSLCLILLTQTMSSLNCCSSINTHELKYFLTFFELFDRNFLGFHRISTRLQSSRHVLTSFTALLPRPSTWNLRITPYD